MDFGFSSNGQEPVENVQQESPRMTDPYAKYNENDRPSAGVGIVGGGDCDWAVAAGRDVYEQCNGEGYAIQ